MSLLGHEHHIGQELSNMSKQIEVSSVPEDFASHVADHYPDKIQHRLNDTSNHSYLRDFVFGAVDGTVTTFAVVSGVVGADLPSGVILILGAANLVGDGFSMAAGNYLSTRADEQLRERARQVEKRHIEIFADGEREEIRQIFLNKGFSGKDLERAVDIITGDPDKWVDTMLKDELGLSLHGPSPWRAAFSTFCSFMCVGILPLLPFIHQFIFPDSGLHPFICSTILTGMTFFGIGAAKSHFVEQHWCRSGIETLFVGGSAAGLAYLIGALLRDVVVI